MLRPSAFALVSIGLVGSSCSLVLGIETLSDDGSGASAAGAVGGTGGVGGAGAGGTGGAGGASRCVPGDSCYDGPRGTEDVGECKAGICNADGVTCDNATTPNVENCATTRTDESCDGLSDCLGEGTWSREGHGPDAQDSMVVAVDAEGSVYVAGDYLGHFHFRDGPELQARVGPSVTRDVFVAKYDRDGVHQWSKTFGDSEEQTIGGIVAGADGVVVTGTYTGTIDFGGPAGLPMADNAIFVASLDTDGDYRWDAAFDGPSEQRGIDIAMDDSNDVYVVASYNDALTLDDPVGELPSASGGLNTLVLKIGSSGDVQWGKAVGGDLFEVKPSRVAVSNDGEVVVAGTFNDGKLMFDGMPVAYQGGDDIYLARFDAGDGTPAGITTFGSADDDKVGGLAVDPTDGASLVAIEHLNLVTLDSEVITSGPMNLKSDVLLVKLLPQGKGFAPVWHFPFFSDGVETVRGLAVDDLGYSVMAGTYDTQLGMLGPPVGQEDLYFAKFDSGGGEIWVKDIGGTGFEGPLDVAVDGVGSPIIAGFYNDEIEELMPVVDTADTTMGSPHDLFLIKRQP